MLHGRILVRRTTPEPLNVEFFGLDKRTQLLRITARRDPNSHFQQYLGGQNTARLKAKSDEPKGIEQ